MNIIGLDLETTGLLTTDHRIIEIYAGRWDLTTGVLEDHFFARINPERSIAAEAQRVHGISAADLSACDKWSDVAPRFLKFMGTGDLVVAHNGDGFDAPFIEQELKRIGLPLIDKPWLDTMLQGRWATPDGKVPNLGELCFATHTPYDATKAHAASYDVQVMMDCFFKGLAWGFFTLPQSEETSLAA